MPDKLITPCQEFSEQVIRYGFNELGFWRRRKVKSHLRCCADCSTAYQEYKLLCEGIDHLQKKRLPELALQRVLLRSLQTAATAKSTMLPHIVRKWGLIMAGVLVLFVAAAIWQSAEKWKHPGYSQVEIKSAKAEVRTALGIVGKVMNRTQETIANQAAAQNITKPVWQTLEMALKPLMNGG